MLLQACHVISGTLSFSCAVSTIIQHVVSAAAGLPGAQQRLALEPAARGTRKVVVATNIAETSLTIEVCTTLQQ
jgi:ERCC4-related helicase